MRLQFVAPPHKAGWCVRDFLRWCGVSSTALRAAKRTPPGLLADGAPVLANAPVYAGMCITLPEIPEAAPTLRPQNLPLQIVWEDAAAVLLEKPAGMAVHPTLGYPDGTLANAWQGELARRGQTGGFHPVWRLDKNTSGLLLAAKNAVAQPFLQRGMRKLYAAILCGRPPAAAPRTPEGAWQLVDAPIARAPDSIIRRRVDAAGAPALTRYRVLGAAGDYTLAAFWLQTGRTHQIRVHMAHLGCPVAGDTLYGTPDARFARQALHCCAAAFFTPGTPPDKRPEQGSAGPASSENTIPGTLPADPTPPGDAVLSDNCSFGASSDACLPGAALCSRQRHASPFPPEMLAAAGLTAAGAALEQLCAQLDSL